MKIWQLKDAQGLPVLVPVGELLLLYIDTSSSSISVSVSFSTAPRQVESNGLSVRVFSFRGSDSTVRCVLAIVDVGGS